MAEWAEKIIPMYFTRYIDGIISWCLFLLKLFILPWNLFEFNVIIIIFRTDLFSKQWTNLRYKFCQYQAIRIPNNFNNVVYRSNKTEYPMMRNNHEHESHKPQPHQDEWFQHRLSFTYSVYSHRLKHCKQTHFHRRTILSLLLLLLLQCECACNLYCSIITFNKWK